MPNKSEYTAGHRERVRRKFMDLPTSSFETYELLELLLMYVIPRRDVKPVAKDLLKEFGSLSQTIFAEPNRLKEIPYVKENATVLFRLIQALTQRMMLEKVKEKTILENWNQLLKYCQVSMAYLPTETFHILFLNAACQLILDYEAQKGTVDQTPAYPREILRKALDVGATSVILVHNHPSGNAYPSKADIAMTKKIVTTLGAADILVHDHLIIAPKSHVSLKSLGFF